MLIQGQGAYFPALFLLCLQQLGGFSVLNLQAELHSHLSAESIDHEPLVVLNRPTPL